LGCVGNSTSEQKYLILINIRVSQFFRILVLSSTCCVLASMLRVPSWESRGSNDNADRSLSKSIKSHTIAQFIEEEAQRQVYAEERIVAEERIKQKRRGIVGPNVTFYNAGMSFTLQFCIFFPGENHTLIYFRFLYIFHRLQRADSLLLHQLCPTSAEGKGDRCVLIHAASMTAALEMSNSSD
jgi:hypothetical protein